MGGPDAGTHALLAHIDAQGQGVDEHAQGPFTALARAHSAEHHGAEHHRITPGDHPQDAGQRQVHHARHAHAKGACEGAQAAAQCAVDGDTCLVDAESIALYILQPERQRRLIDIRQHLAEESLMGLFADAMAHLCDIAAKRHRLSGQGLLAGQVQLDFMAHHIQGGMVEDGVVKQQRRRHTPRD